MYAASWRGGVRATRARPRGGEPRRGSGRIDAGEGRLGDRRKARRRLDGMGRRAGGGQDRGRPFPPTRPPPDSHTLPHPAPSHHNPRPASRNPIPNPIPTPSTSSILILGSSQLTLLSSTAPSRCCTTHHGTPHPAQFYRAFTLLHYSPWHSSPCSVLPRLLVAPRRRDQLPRDRCQVASRCGGTGRRSERHRRDAAAHRVHARRGRCCGGVAAGVCCM